jgi:putative acetyltransferase
MIDLRPNQPSDAERLLQIWRDAVDSSHHFLSPEDRAAIDPLVADYVRDASLLVATLDGVTVGFMGRTGQNIDSLFIHPSARGRGVGRRLMELVGRPSTVDVNEQNSEALAFYRHLGFEIAGRSELDDQGRPYPLLHLRRD